MNKCLVTKLDGSSNNPDLLRLGEMRMKILKVSNPTEHTQGFSIGVNNNVTLEIVSNGYFTDKTLTENKGKNITINAGTSSVWVSGNNDVEIAILDKYSLTSLATYYVTEASSDVYGKNIKLDISDLKYSTALTSIVLSEAQVSGDIANLKNLTALISLNLYNAQVPLTGDIGQLSTLSSCVSISLKYSKLTGDLAILPSKLRFVSFANDKGSVFTWSTRQSTAKIIAIEGNASLTNIDQMLQNQAQCQVGFTSHDYSWYKTISVSGKRTSASDDAVATLQQNGYTISIAKA